MTTDEAAIEQLWRDLVDAHGARDARAIVEAYAPEAVIYSLAPPLAQCGMDRDEVSAWLATWDGPIQLDARDVRLVVEADLALASSLNRMRGSQGGVAQDIWYRATTCMRREAGRWRIVHEHTSVPFYMDGSYRAAVDLHPQSDGGSAV